MAEITRRTLLLACAAATVLPQGISANANVDELSTMDATGLAELVRKGKVSALELVDAAIRRIEKLNPRINAVIWERFEKARQEARGALPKGPFRGVPFLTKDVGCTTAGEPESQGSRFLKNHNYTATATAELAKRIRAAGFVNLGRTNAPEFATMTTTEPLAFGPTRNPWDLTRTPGGSSGGTAAAVASLMVPVAHGNDAGGSIRIPAAACGVVGLKPTRGRISSAPGDELTVPLSVQGFLTRSVRDMAACLDFAAGAAPGDPTVPPPPQRPFVQELDSKPPSLRIGLLSRLPKSVEGLLDPACKKAADDAGRLLESLGHHVEPAEPSGVDDPKITAVYLRLLGSRALNRLLGYERRIGERARADEVETGNASIMELARAMSAVDYLQDLEQVNTFTRQFAGWWSSGFDLLLSPSTAVLPPKLGTLGIDPQRRADMLSWSVYARPFNFSGLPAITLPLFWSEGGLPIGVQLGAAYGREDLLISVAAQLENAQPWHMKLPSSHA
jgi:amidase